MIRKTDLPQTKLAITGKLSFESSSYKIINKINEIIDKINFLDEHINFLYERSLTQYNTLTAQASGLQNVYDEFQEFKKRFNVFRNPESEIITLELKNAKLESLPPSIVTID